MTSWYDQWKAQDDARKREDARRAAKRRCQQELQALTHTWADGSVVQTRPQDRGNFRDAIESGLNHEWILADNTTRPNTTPAELQEAYDSGVAQGVEIHQRYIDTLKALNASD